MADNQLAPPPSPLRIKQDGKFYERLLTKESSGNSLSFRYYWAEPGSVPFVWETQPGTPKDIAALAAGALPAITPPPSYMLGHGTGKVVAASAHHEQSKKGKKKGCRLRRIRIGFITGIFRRLSLMKAWRRPAPPVKVSSSSRWLFCSVATERRDKHDDHHKTVMCGSFRRPRPCPWLLRFRSAGNGGWAQIEALKRWWQEGAQS
jgi:hypothetical protein